ncbi:TSN8 protein, partial [Psilopogon haemacephalus]|nr:TSN8 protein [Psilopogon haemacephalus]
MARVSSCMKYSMFIFNFIFWLCGCIILGVSIWIRVSKNAQQVNALSGAQDCLKCGRVDVLIGVGSVIMVLGFLGCCGAIKESQCMLLLFFIGLLLILILQVAGGVLGAVYRSQIETSINQTLTENINILKSSTEDSKVFQEKFQKFQEMNQCCGLLNGPADWGKNFNVPLGDKKICQCEVEKPSTDLCTYYESRLIYTKTCGNVIVTYFKNHLLIIVGIAFGLAVVEILGLGFSMSLYCQIQRK